MDETNAISEILIKLGWTEVGIGVLLIGILQVLVGLLVKSHLENSIKGKYDKLMKDYEFNLKMKEQAVGVAKLLANARYNKGQDSKDSVADIWALSLWLPAPLVCHLTEHLVGENPEYQNPKDLLIKIRKELHGKQDTLEAKQIAHL